MQLPIEKIAFNWKRKKNSVSYDSRKCYKKNKNIQICFFSKRDILILIKIQYTQGCHNKTILLYNGNPKGLSVSALNQAMYNYNNGNLNIYLKEIINSGQLIFKYVFSKLFQSKRSLKYDTYMEN